MRTSALILLLAIPVLAAGCSSFNREWKKAGEQAAQFHAKYHGILSFGYTVPLKVEKTNDSFQFSGEADLGSMAGGMYQYKGHADPTNFFSNYSSKDDHGTFQMSRPDGR
jgi:hypothetical protein